MYSKKSLSLLLALSAFGCFMPTTFANETPNAHSLVENNNLIASPNYTTIITKEQIHDNHYKNLAEALSYANGVTVNPGSLNTSHMVVRIDGDDRVAIFVDGHRMNMNKGIMSGRASYDLDLLPSIMNVERIEILHGAVGSTYLNYDTPAGAINIVTKKGDKRETTIDLAAGEHGSWKVKAITSGSLDDWSWVATGGFDNVDYMKYKGTDDHTHEMPNSDNNRREMAYRIDKKLTDNTSLTFDYGHLSNDTGTWISKSYPQDYNYEKLINHFALTYNYKENTETPAFLAIYHYYTQGDSYIPTGLSDQENEKTYSRWENTTQGIDWHDAWKISKDHTISAGLTYRKDEVDNINNDYNNIFSGNYNKSMDNFSVYLQSTRRFDKLTLTGTSAYNNNSEFGGKYVSNGALDYKPDENTVIYASLSQIYATPFLDDLYFNNAHIQGNPNLRPETGYKGSLGVRYKLNPTSNINFNAFLENIDDPLGWRYENNKFHAVNFENQKKRGFQLEYNKIFSPKYDMSLAYTRTITHTDFADGNGNQTDVNAIAPSSYKLRFSYHDDTWHNNILLNAVSGRDTNYYSDSNYYILDANLNYKINDQWSTYLKLANITNVSYETIGSFLDGDCPAPGRTVLMGMEYTF